MGSPFELVAKAIQMRAPTRAVRRKLVRVMGFFTAQIVSGLLTYHRIFAKLSIQDKCTDPDCDALKKHIEWQGLLHMVAFCSNRE